MLDWLFHPVKDSKPYWLEILPPTITILLAVIGYWWAFKVWKKQKNIETQIWAGQQKETARIAACKAAWSLLAYMSEKENSKTVFVSRGTKDHKIWHLRLAQGLDYFNEFEKVFFTDGHGIFLSTKIKDDLFTFRSILYRIIDKEKHKMNEQGKKVDLFNSRSISYQITAGEDQKINEEGEENELSNLIQVEESGVIDKIVELRERLNERLRAEIKTGSFLQID